MRMTDIIYQIEKVEALPRDIASKLTSYETIVRQASKYMSRRNASAPQLEAAFTYLSAVVDG
jgi:hypothetical protein